MLIICAAAYCCTAVAGGPGDVLAESYREAHDASDVEALKSLVYWDGATERSREIIAERLTRHIGRKVETIEFRELSGDEDFKWEGYRPNLDPVGWLAVYFEHDPYDTRLFTVAYVVGELDGRYVITVAKKVE